MDGAQHGHVLFLPDLTMAIEISPVGTRQYYEGEWIASEYKLRQPFWAQSRDIVDNAPYRNNFVHSPTTFTNLRDGLGQREYGVESSATVNLQGTVTAFGENEVIADVICSVNYGWDNFSSYVVEGDEKHKPWKDVTISLVRQWIEQTNVTVTTTDFNEDPPVTTNTTTTTYAPKSAYLSHTFTANSFVYNPSSTNYSSYYKSWTTLNGYVMQEVEVEGGFIYVPSFEIPSLASGAYVVSKFGSSAGEFNPDTNTLTTVNVSVFHKLDSDSGWYTQAITHPGFHFT